jgi:hypothetical protein
MAAASVTLPESFLYGTKSGLPRIKSQQIAFSASNLTYSVNNQTQIRIDISPINGGYLEAASSFLSFRVSVTGDSLTLDPSAYSFINTVSLYSLSMSTLLEQVTDVSVLAALLFDLSTSIMTTQQGYSTLAGFSETNRRAGATIANGATRTFAICLPSVLGLFSGEKLLPMAGFTLIIGLNNLTTVGTSAGTPVASIDNVFYYAAVHEVPPEVQNMILSSNGGLITLPCMSYRSYNGTVPAATYSNSLTVGARLVA